MVKATLRGRLHFFLIMMFTQYNESIP